MNEKLSIEDAPEDRRLSGLLVALPREKASEDFTARVLQRIQAAPPRTAPAQTAPPGWPVSPPILAAAALLFISLAFGGQELWHRHQRQETAARYEALHAEIQALEAELHGLRRLAVEARPVLYLGGDETVEYVVDLSRSHRRREDAYPALGNTVPGNTVPGNTVPGNTLTGSPRQLEATTAPDLSTTSTEMDTEMHTEMDTEMDHLSPSQLRQHPRRIY